MNFDGTPFDVGELTDVKDVSGNMGLTLILTNTTGAKCVFKLQDDHPVRQQIAHATMQRGEIAAPRMRIATSSEREAILKKIGDYTPDEELKAQCTANGKPESTAPKISEPKAQTTGKSKPTRLKLGELAGGAARPQRSTSTP